MEWMPPEQYSREAAPRAALGEAAWLGAMRAVCARHGLPARGLAMFKGGSDVVFGGDGFVVKLTTPAWRAQMANERVMLSRVAGRIGVETPRVVASGELSGWPYLVMTRLEGMRGLCEAWEGLGGADRRRVAGEVGAVARRLFALPFDAGEVGRWMGWMDGLRRSVGARHGRHVPEGWGAVEGFVAGVAPRELALGWVHTELMSDHVMVRGEGAGCHVVGLIDFADARVGHPDYEWPALVEFVFKGEAGCLRACLEGFGRTLGDGGLAEARRLAVWGLWHRYGSLPRSLAAAGVPAPRGWDEWAVRLYGIDG